MTVEPGQTVQSGTKGLIAKVTCGSSNILDAASATVSYITESDSDATSVGTETSADEFATLTLV